MTYPQQYAPPQGGWPTQAPPPAAPQGPAVGWGQPGYGPGNVPQQPQQQPPAPVSATLPPPSWDSASDPTGGGGGGIRARHLVGCTVVFLPKSVSLQPGLSGQAARDNVVAHLIVVDSPRGYIEYGDSQDRDVSKQRPNTHRVRTPALFRGAVFAEQQIASALKAALPSQGGTGLIKGVVEQGTQGNRPFLLAKMGTTVTGEDRPDVATREAAARAAYDQFYAGNTAAFGVPEVIFTPTQQGQQPPAAPQYAPQQYAPQQYAQQYPPPGVPQYAPQPYVPPTAPAPSAPPGMDPAEWASMPPEMQQQIMTSYAAVPGAVPATPQQPVAPSMQVPGGWPTPGQPGNAGL